MPVPSPATAVFEAPLGSPRRQRETIALEHLQTHDSPMTGVVPTLYTVRMSRRLSNVLDALSDETLDLAAKWMAFRRIW